VRRKTRQEDLIVRYLLGDLSEEEQVRVEERFFTDDEYFEQMCAVEDALVDDYVQEALTEAERRKVESLLLSSPQQAREIKFAGELIGHISKPLPGELTEGNPNQADPPNKWRSPFKLLPVKNTGGRFVFAAAFLLIAVGIFLAVWDLALLRELDGLRARQAAMEEKEQELQKRIDQQADDKEAASKELESERKRREQIERELAALQESGPPVSANEIATLDLNNDSFPRGGGESKVVHISGSVSRLQIRVNLDQGAYNAYGAVIKTVEGQAIWSKDQIRPRRGNSDRIVLALPAGIFANHDYILTLKGQSDAGSSVEIGDYPFRVRR
jgi:hypothetical protein